MKAGSSPPPFEDLAAALKAFIGRTDSYAIQKDGGSYDRVFHELSEATLLAHCKGQSTVSAYTTNSIGNSPLFMLDIDSRGQAAKDLALFVQGWLEHFGIPSFIEASGMKGFHVWGIFKCFVPATKAKRLLQLAVAEWENEHGKPDFEVEVNPKQANPTTEEKPGSCVRLPWGIHRVTKKRTCFLTPDFKPLPDWGLEAFQRAKRITEADLDAILAEFPEPEESRRTQRSTGAHYEHDDIYNSIAVNKALEHCAFLKHDKRDAEKLPRNDWWSAVQLLAPFGTPGEKAIHELSAPYPSYTEKETDEYIRNALKSFEEGIGPHSCEFIQRELGFSCPDDCMAMSLNVKSPAGLASKLAAQERSPYTFSDDGSLPEIVVSNRQLRDKTTDALAALYEANSPEILFIRSGGPVRISTDEKGIPYIEQLSEAALRGRLTRTCNFFRFDNKGEKIAVPPPLEVVQDCLSLGVWGFPPLLGITEVPVMRPDGTVVTQPGYDTATCLYYFPSSKLSVPGVAEVPTKADFGAAVALIQECICDFPFDSEASRANAVGAIFTPILRPMIDGAVPLAAIDKPQAGTGASLFAEAISLIATGRQAAMMSAQKDDEGWRKAITSLLLKGQLVAIIDNISSTLWAPSLSVILTSVTFQDRILGRSEMVSLPNRTTWIATGNNIRLAGDLPRRVVWIRLDAQVARPWLRDTSKFRHPRLMEWLSANRGAILAAILTIARSWVADDKPEPLGLPSLGGYEDYCRVIGGVLNYMGVEGFLANLNAMYDEMDVDTPQWEAFLQIWFETIRDPITANELSRYVTENDDLRAVLPDGIDNVEAKNFTWRLGKILSKKRNVRFPNNLYLIKAGDKKRATLWQVVSLENANSPDFSYRREFGESDITPAPPEEEEENLYKGGGESISLKLVNSPTEPCPCCGSENWWQRPSGKWLCRCCHPKPEEKR